MLNDGRLVEELRAAEIWPNPAGVHHRTGGGTPRGCGGGGGVAVGEWYWVEVVGNGQVLASSEELGLAMVKKGEKDKDKW